MQIQFRLHRIEFYELACVTDFPLWSAICVPTRAKDSRDLAAVVCKAIFNLHRKLAQAEADFAVASSLYGRSRSSLIGLGAWKLSCFFGLGQLIWILLLQQAHCNYYSMVKPISSAFPPWIVMFKRARNEMTICRLIIEQTNVRKLLANWILPTRPIG